VRESLLLESEGEMDELTEESKNSRQQSELKGGGEEKLYDGSKGGRLLYIGRKKERRGNAIER
jgi:hypothetical protein